MNVRVLICGHMTNLPLVDSNIKTVWVEITGRIIKRHRVKHRVEEAIAVDSLPVDGVVHPHGRTFYVPWYIMAWRWIIGLFKERS